MKLFLLLLALQGSVQPQPIPPRAYAAAVASEDASVLLLRQEVRLLREHETELRETVHFALNAVFVLVSLLLAFGWWTNFRVYERDKDAIRREVLVAAEQQASRMREDLTNQLAAARDELRRELQNARDRLAAVSGEAYRPAVDDLRRQLLDVRFDGLKQQVEIQRLRNSPSMAATHAIRWLRLATQEGEKYEITSALEVLMWALDAKGKFTTAEVTELTAILGKLPADHTVIRDRILTGLREAGVM